MRGMPLAVAQTGVIRVDRAGPAAARGRSPPSGLTHPAPCRGRAVVRPEPSQRARHVLQRTRVQALLSGLRASARALTKDAERWRRLDQSDRPPAFSSARGPLTRLTAMQFSASRRSGGEVGGLAGVAQVRPRRCAPQIGDRPAAAGSPRRRRSRRGSSPGVAAVIGAVALTRPSPASANGRHRRRAAAWTADAVRGPGQGAVDWHWESRRLSHTPPNHYPKPNQRQKWYLDPYFGFAETPEPVGRVCERAETRHPSPAAVRRARGFTSGHPDLRLRRRVSLFDTLFATTCRVAETLYSGREREDRRQALSTSGDRARTASLACAWAAVGGSSARQRLGPATSWRPAEIDLRRLLISVDRPDVRSLFRKYAAVRFSLAPRPD